MNKLLDTYHGKITGVIIDTIESKRLPELSARGQKLVNKFNQSSTELRLIPWNRIPGYETYLEFLDVLKHHIIENAEYDYECDVFPAVVRMTEELEDIGRVYTITLDDIKRVETTAGTFTQTDLQEMISLSSDDD